MKGAGEWQPIGADERKCTQVQEFPQLISWKIFGGDVKDILSCKAVSLGVKQFTFKLDCVLFLAITPFKRSLRQVSQSTRSQVSKFDWLSDL